VRVKYHMFQLPGWALGRTVGPASPTVLRERPFGVGAGNGPAKMGKVQGTVRLRWERGGSIGCVEF
jgi:hypothetical protein